MTKKLDVQVLIDDFVKHAVIQGEATYEGDYKTGNKASNKLFKISKMMEREREVAQQMLDVLLEHDNISVRIWASGKALDIGYKYAEAVETLKKIAKMSEAGILGLNAEMSLKVRKLL
ncbi:DUF2019 domain-containing protein [Desulfoscipio sp. XC116]|uniref:DUF2019 domain-containing protein n=1 Tax=Desulfoscipio sp. XC116 TaxID=3144975 RepID=UPI00325B8515